MHRKYTLNNIKPIIISKQNQYRNDLARYLPLMFQKQVLMAHHFSVAPTLEQEIVDNLRHSGHDEEDILDICLEPVLDLDEPKVSQAMGID